MNERFDLVFKGELVPGCDLAQTKKNIANLFKISLEKVEVLFSGRTVFLKRNLDANAANTYRVAIKNAGARVNIEESKSQKDAIANQTQVAKAEVDQANTGKEQNNSNNITVQAVGENLLKPEERSTDSGPLAIDLGHLTLRDLQGYLVDFNEIDRPQALDVQAIDVSLSGLDEPLLKPDERDVEAAPATNLQNIELSVAEPGSILSDEQKSTVQAPNTDHIQLQTP